MSWSPKYNFEFVEPVIDNVLRVIKRDEQEALNWANGGEDLPPFALHERARRVYKKFPVVVVVGVEWDPVENDERQLEQVSMELLLEIALTGSDPAELERLVQKYTRAVAMILMTANYTEFLQGSALAGHFCNVAVRNVKTGETLVHKEQAGLYYQSAAFRLLLEV